MLKLFWEQSSLGKRVYREGMQPVCETYQLTRMELDVLLFLANNPQYDTATDMVEVRCFTKSHVSTAVKALEERGYLVKHFEDGNRKTVHLKVTDAAEEAVTDGRAVQRKFFEVISAGITKEEILQQMSLMEKVNSNLRRALKED